MKDEFSIDQLEEMVAALPAAIKFKFERIYEISTGTGELVLNNEMENWAKKQFGSIEAVTCQKIVRLTNLVTGEESFYNKLRTLRPSEVSNKTSLNEELVKDARNDIFRSPEIATPEDLIGRIRGKYCITASNIAKSGSLHGLVIFNDFNPLDFTREKVVDYIDTGREWAERMHSLKPEAKYFLFFWNCLKRAGATQSHGHCQVLLATGKHYSKIEILRKSALEYKKSYNSNYFDDLFEVHQALGYATENGGIRFLSYLTPLKYDEVIILSDTLKSAFKTGLFDMLALFRDELKTTSFNFGLITPPFGDTQESWEGFPCIGHIIDRGSYDDRTSDFGGFELFGATMVLGDPYLLATKIRNYFRAE
jgi:hypothetical protein